MPCAFSKIGIYLVGCGPALLSFLVMATCVGADEHVPARKSQPFLEKLTWGRDCVIESTLILQMEESASEQAISIPRLNNPVKAVYFRGMPDHPLQLVAEPRAWTIMIPEDRQAGTGQAIVLQLEGAPYLPVQPRCVEQDDEGQVFLAAHDVVTHGKSLRYEPQPHKNTLGYWTEASDWAEWHFTIDRPGTFQVQLRYGCGDGQGGSVVQLGCGKETLRWTVTATGGFQEWREWTPGVLKINKPGRHALVLKPVELAHLAVMDVQQIKLVPVDGRE